MARCSKVSPMRPSAFYFRKALRDTDDPERLRDIGLLLVTELERTKAWIREQGMIPPKFEVLTEESMAKGRKGQPDADLRECDDCDACEV